jgi:hypothetical protein
MEVITIQSDAFQAIMDRLEAMESYFKPLSEGWLDIDETCKLLKISKRTLQGYRDGGLLTFSQIGGKIYISAGAIEEFLRSHTRKAFVKPKYNL